MELRVCAKPNPEELRPATKLHVRGSFEVPVDNLERILMYISMSVMNTRAASKKTRLTTLSEGYRVPARRRRRRTCVKPGWSVGDR